MPDTGTPWNLSYPAIGEAANVPEDIGDLAADTAAALSAIQAASGGVAVEVVNSDAGFPAAAINQTTATVVLDRYTIAAKTYARKVLYSLNVYVAVSIDATQVNLVAFAGSTIIGYARKAVAGSGLPDELVVHGKYDLPANTAVVVEARLSRQAGTGTFSSSTSTMLTSGHLQLVRV
jgi:hypothetical protein